MNRDKKIKHSGLGVEHDVIAREGNSLERSGENTFRENLTDILVFIGMLAFSIVAALALLIAAPFALVTSAITGIFRKRSRRSQWRPANAS